MKQADLDGFTGGFTFEEHPGAFQAGMWSRLDGFVFEQSNRLRSQPPIFYMQPTDVSPGVLREVAETWVDGSTLYFIDADSDRLWKAPIDPAAVVDLASVGNLAVEYISWAAVPAVDRSTGAAVTSSTTVSPPANSPRMIGRVRFASEGTHYSGEAEGGVVLQDSGATKAWVVYDGQSSELVKGIPASTSVDVVPDGRVVGTWGDFTIWGDILWYADADAGTGSQRYRNGLWFSQPAKFNSYDPIDVVFLPSVDAQAPKVMDMVAVPAGLMVFCDIAVYLLRGNGADFEIEQVSSNGVNCLLGADFYGKYGAAVWCDPEGRVWLSDGNSVQRLDDGVGVPDSGIQGGRPQRPFPAADQLGGASCRVVADKLVVARSPGHELMVFQAVEGVKGVWTQIVLPEFNGDTGDFVAQSLAVSSLYGGLFFTHRAPTSSNANRMVWIDFGGATSGLKRGWHYWHWSEGPSGDTVSLTLSTPILTVKPHQTAWWRRVGVRLGRTEDTAAELTDVTQWVGGGRADSGPDGTYEDGGVAPGALAFVASTFSKVVHRRHIVVPGVGPARVWRADFTFSGDVTIEGVSAWLDGELPDWGRPASQAGTA